MNSTPSVSGSSYPSCQYHGAVKGHRGRPPAPVISLDNRARTLEIPGSSDPNIIPDGDFSSFVRVTGQSLVLSHEHLRVPETCRLLCFPVRLGPHSLILTFSSFTASEPLDTLGSEGALSPGGIASLLKLPRGCAEQTMIYLAPTLTASHYLDKTEQWSKLPPETKDRAVDLIQKGSLFSKSQSHRQGGHEWLLGAYKKLGVVAGCIAWAQTAGEWTHNLTASSPFQGTCASSSSGRKMAPLGLGCTGTAAPGEAGPCVQGLRRTRDHKTGHQRV